MNDHDRSVNGLCQHRSVAADGRIVCAKITLGDNEVSPNLCRNCPAKTIACHHLRFSLQKSSPSAIVVRYVNGRTEVWNDKPPSVSFLRAACAAKVAPITSPRECAPSAPGQGEGGPAQARRRPGGSLTTTGSRHRVGGGIRRRFLGHGLTRINTELFPYYSVFVRVRLCPIFLNIIKERARNRQSWLVCS